MYLLLNELHVVAKNSKIPSKMFSDGKAAWLRHWNFIPSVHNNQIISLEDPDKITPRGSALIKKGSLEKKKKTRLFKKYRKTLGADNW
jgi:hypothetical protein